MNLKRPLRALIERAGYRLGRAHEPLAYPYLDVLELLIRLRLALGESLYFVQIGANDGQTMDPLGGAIDRHALCGLMVEPQPAVFEQLRAHRGHDRRLSLENAIVGAEDGTATLYVPQLRAGMPRWLGQAASLDRRQLVAVLEQHLRKQPGEAPAHDIDAMIQAVELPCLSMATLLRKHQVQRVDLLVLDTMGFDAELIRRFPFEQVRPAIIQFEHRLMAREDHADCVRLLGQKGYSLCRVDMDTLAVLDAPTRPGSLQVA